MACAIRAEPARSGSGSPTGAKPCDRYRCMAGESATVTPSRTRCAPRLFAQASAWPSSARPAPSPQATGSGRHPHLVDIGHARLCDGQLAPDQATHRPPIDGKKCPVRIACGCRCHPRGPMLIRLRCFRRPAAAKGIGGILQRLQTDIPVLLPFMRGDGTNGNQGASLAAGGRQPFSHLIAAGSNGRGRKSGSFVSGYLKTCIDGSNDCKAAGAAIRGRKPGSRSGT